MVTLLPAHQPSPLSSPAGAAFFLVKKRDKTSSRYACPRTQASYSIYATTTLVPHFSGLQTPSEGNIVILSVADPQKWSISFLCQGDSRDYATHIQSS